jgi:hypothetical protein
MCPNVPSDLSEQKHPYNPEEPKIDLDSMYPVYWASVKGYYLDGAPESTSLRVILILALSSVTT